jgi:hypothetical protein
MPHVFYYKRPVSLVTVGRFVSPDIRFMAKGMGGYRGTHPG